MKTEYRIKSSGFLNFDLHYKKTIRIFGYNFTYWSFIKSDFKGTVSEIPKKFPDIKDYFVSLEEKSKENKEYFKTIYIK